MADAPQIANPLENPYSFDEEYERMLVFYCATSPDFYERAGKFLMPDLLGSDAARLAIRAIQAICKAHQHARHPASTTLVVQRAVKFSQEDGTVRIEHARDVRRYLSLDPSVLPKEELVLGELIPIVETRLAQFNATYASRAVLPADRQKMLKRVKQTTEMIEALRKPKAALRDSVFSRGVLAGAVAASRMQRVRFGILELDAIFRGGARKSEMGFFVGGEKEGKSTALLHGAASNARDLGFSLYASLENTLDMAWFRFAANVSHLPMWMIEERPEVEAECQRRLDWLIEHQKIGRLHIEEFPGAVTTVADIFEWVEQVEEEVGRRADAVYVDADEHLAFDDSSHSDYKGFGKVYAELRNHAKGSTRPSEHPELCRVVFTASQAKSPSPQQREKIKKGGDAADSRRKVRVADFCVTLNARGDQKERIILNASDCRNGASGMTTELPTNYECGQLVTISDPWPWLIDPKGWARGGGIDQRDLFR